MKSYWVVLLIAGLLAFGGVVGLLRAADGAQLASHAGVAAFSFYLAVQLVRLKRHAWVITLLVYSVILGWNAILLTATTVINGGVELSHPAFQIWAGRGALALVIVIALLSPPVARSFRSASAQT